MILEVDHLVKAYGDHRANDDVSLAVSPGEVFGLLGPNGAGKTTLVKQVLTLLRPDAGRIAVDGVDVAIDPARARRTCSSLPQAQMATQGLTPPQAIELVGRIRGGARAAVRDRAGALMAELDLGPFARTPGAAQSGGVGRLVGFCMATVVPGRLVILDEPTNDVDPARRRVLWSLIRGLADQGSAVLLVTHNVLEADRAVDRLAIIDQGRILAQGTPAELKAALPFPLRLEVTLEPGAVAPPPPPFLAASMLHGRRLVADLDTADSAPAIAWARQLQDDGVAEEFGLGPASLEDAYLRVVAPIASLTVVEESHA